MDNKTNTPIFDELSAKYDGPPDKHDSDASEGRAIDPEYIDGSKLSPAGNIALIPHPDTGVMMSMDDLHKSIAQDEQSQPNHEPDASVYPNAHKDLGATALEVQTAHAGSALKIEVTGFLSPTAKDMLDALNKAVEKDETTIQGDSFRVYITRAVRESGYITPHDGKILTQALDFYEAERNKRRM